MCPFRAKALMGAVMEIGTAEKGKTKDKALIGAAGEYYVAFRLSAEGYAVGLTTHGTRSIDMLIANPDTGKSITIQTKTMRDAFVRSRKWGPYWKWRVGTTSRRPAHKTFFYAFVGLRDDPSKETPDVFIVPSILLTPLLEEYTGDNWCVIYEKDQGNYLHRWDVIRDSLA